MSKKKSEHKNKKNPTTLVRITQVLLASLMLFLLTPVLAHKSSTAYITIDATQNAIEIKADIAIRDIQNIIELDLNYDNNITWRELKAGRQHIFDYFMTHISLRSIEGDCSLQSNDYKVDQHSDGPYIVLYVNAVCAKEASRLDFGYTLFSDVDSQHRAMLKLVSKAGEQAYALAPNQAALSLQLHERDSFVTFTRYIEEGITHIFAGFDHILFLISLLLPVVLVRSAGKWQGVCGYREVMLDVVKVVTAFTIAHSITFGIVLVKNISLQVNWVEGIIAFSVIIAALNNLIPVVSGKRWLIGFVFGLIHGLGFASVFIDSGLMTGSTFISLLGFNIGVELGQLLIVLAVLPIAYFARNGWIYQRLVVQLGSMSIVMIGVYWLIERTLMV